MSHELDATSGELDRTCPECQTGFRVDSVTSRRKYCSPTCREKDRSHLLTQRTCPQCEREFTTTLSPKRMFCSPECRTAAREAQTETRNLPGLREPLPGQDDGPHPLLLGRLPPRSRAPPRPSPGRETGPPPGSGTTRAAGPDRAPCAATGPHRLPAARSRP
ncbi:hypothetical protein SGFS_017330 [Streptomyces graminofaciens]|uniref:Uncharacterized protein n=1 Tax=Streptomyces graminofaciens TaxID=68212 RepID=A0ABM7F3M6_9ACTN|nr:hypothetical protein SGFS_017330 [Streptomyces graminofaciens]